MMTSLTLLCVGLFAGWWLQEWRFQSRQQPSLEAAQVSTMQQTIEEQNLRIQQHDQRVERLRGEWMAVMRMLSHQLKNPLSMMLSGLRMIRELRPDLKSRQGQESLALLEQYGEESVEWVDSLVWLSRSEQTEIQASEVHLERLLSQVQLFLKAEGSHSGTIESSAQLPSVVAVEGWVEEIFKRLIRCSRRLKPASRQWEWEVRSEQEVHRLWLHVHSEKQHGFSTSDTRRELHEFGEFSMPLELDMLIVTQLAQNMGGDAGVESGLHRSTESNGTPGTHLSFWFELPASTN